jgi:hypothetical protein
MSFFRKATFVATGGASGMVIKANSKKERTAKAMEDQVRLQKQQIELQRPARTGDAIPAMMGSSPPVPLADELAKLAALREQGILTNEEFDEQKHRLLESQRPPEPAPARETEKRTGGFLAGLRAQAQAGAAAGQAAVKAKQDRKAPTEAAKLKGTAERGAHLSDDE